LRLFSFGGYGLALEALARMTATHFLYQTPSYKRKVCGKGTSFEGSPGEALFEESEVTSVSFLIFSICFQFSATLQLSTSYRSWAAPALDAT